MQKFLLILTFIFSSTAYCQDDRLDYYEFNMLVHNALDSYNAIFKSNTKFGKGLKAASFVDEANAIGEYHNLLSNGINPTHEPYLDPAYQEGREICSFSIDNLDSSDLIAGEFEYVIDVEAIKASIDMYAYNLPRRIATALVWSGCHNRLSESFSANLTKNVIQVDVEDVYSLQDTTDSINQLFLHGDVTEQAQIDPVFLLGVNSHNAQKLYRKLEGLTDIDDEYDRQQYNKAVEMGREACKQTQKDIERNVCSMNMSLIEEAIEVVPENIGLLAETVVFSACNKQISDDYVHAYGANVEPPQPPSNIMIH